MAKATKSSKITHAIVRMYCMGTGDCFIVKFFAGKTLKFKMMIDCGVWIVRKAEAEKAIKDLKAFVNNSVDLLVVTHEHKDHVSIFEACADLLTKNFEVKRIWMGWAENDELSKIKKWKTEHGEKKVALALASERIEKALGNESLNNSMDGDLNGSMIMAAKRNFSDSLKNFAELHIQGVNGVYKGMLEGMKVVKKQIAKNNIEYFYPGNIIEDLPGLKGVKFYVLGPPEEWESVRKEEGEEGETYRHNKELKGTDAFAASILGAAAGTKTEIDNILPFESDYESPAPLTRGIYENTDEDWRKIDYDWLFSAGSLALRINSLTNNLSLALAIEFDGSKKVMLFPGDAEFGSWESWHKINWQGVKSEKEGIHFTQDLLRRTVFYKIAHHMSHHGTAQKLGLEMMEDKDLAAMATLDYDNISTTWKNTMPNRGMLVELLKRTKGRLMILNESKLFFDFHEKEPLTDKIKEAQKKMSSSETASYKTDYVREKGNLYVEYRVKV